MRYAIDHDFHIHSKISLCSQDEGQTNEAILNFARENELKKIVLTDHFWDESVPGAINFYKEQNFEHISKALPLPKDKDVEFLFGAETDMRHDMTLGITKERFNSFDFVIIPTTHFHMRGFTIKESDAESAEGRAEMHLQRLEGLLSMPLPFKKIGVAHLTVGLIGRTRDELLEVLRLLPEDRLAKIFTRASELGAGIELNLGCMRFAESEAELILKQYLIAKSKGCKFYLGSDAHHPKSFEDFTPTFSRAIDYLSLKESDKFTF